MSAGPSDGEVAVRTGSSYTTLDAPGLDSRGVEVDVSHGGDPLVRVPEDARVEYRPEVATDGDVALALDGETLEVGGLHLDDDHVDLLLFVGFVASLTAGYLWGASESIAALIALAAGGALLKLGLAARAGGSA